MIICSLPLPSGMGDLVATVDVLKEILDWSSDRPPWQRDALRRLVTQGELEGPREYFELRDLCKARYGLSEKRQADPLAAKHLPPPGAGCTPVSLVSLTHHAGVNA